MLHAGHWTSSKRDRARGESTWIRFGALARHHALIHGVQRSLATPPHTILSAAAAGGVQGDPLRRAGQPVQPRPFSSASSAQRTAAAADRPARRRSAVSLQRAWQLPLRRSPAASRSACSPPQQASLPFCSATIAALLFSDDRCLLFKRRRGGTARSACVIAQHVGDGGFVVLPRRDRGRLGHGNEKKRKKMMREIEIEREESRNDATHKATRVIVTQERNNATSAPLSFVTAGSAPALSNAHEHPFAAVASSMHQRRPAQRQGEKEREKERREERKERKKERNFQK